MADMIDVFLFGIVVGAGLICAVVQTFCPVPTLEFTLKRLRKNWWFWANHIRSGEENSNG